MTWTPLLKWFPLSLINLNTYTYVCSCTLPMSMWGLFWSFWDNFFWWMKLHIGEYHLGFYHHRIFEQKRVKTEMVMKLLLDRVNFRTVMTFPCIQCFFLLSISWNLREFNGFFLYSEFHEFSVGWKIFSLVSKHFHKFNFSNILQNIREFNHFILFLFCTVNFTNFLTFRFFFFLRRGKNARFFRHSVVKREILSHRKKISSNQFFGNFFSKTIAFTKFLQKKCEREFLQFPHSV